ncbi:hypothetical protein TWF481_010803 [Arthrobotrys musiformis]|uniref:F-box domain-containing protein n=1 Tax=Arthrobotrys musiformis TaxID=47236 RepID=A0AAV9W2X2_9PEZI
MPPLPLLATELLLKIFSSGDFTNANIANFQRVCRLFRAICPYKRIIFRVDAPNQSAWKLLHYTLFKDSSIATNCSEVLVRFERRNFSDKATWTKRWSWTAEERKYIENLCEEKGLTEQVVNNIVEAVNSEAALPLFLCFTPQLRSLHFESIVKDVLVAPSIPRSSYGPVLRIAGVPPVRRKSPMYRKRLTALQYPGARITRRSASSKLSDYVKELTPTGRTLWFFDYFTWINSPRQTKIQLPLRQLRHFGIGDSQPVLLYEFAPIFSYPDITSLEINCHNWHTDVMVPLENVKATIPAANIQNLTRLKMVGQGMGPYVGTCDVWQWFHDAVDHLAESTSSLREVYIRTIDHGGSMERDEGGRRYHKECQCISYTRSENVGRLFLKFNQETLNPMRVLVNGSGFDEKGVFQPGAERRREEVKKEQLWKRSTGCLSSKVQVDFEFYPFVNPRYSKEILQY